MSLVSAIEPLSIGVRSIGRAPRRTGWAPRKMAVGAPWIVDPVGSAGAGAALGAKAKAKAKAECG